MTEPKRPDFHPAQVLVDSGTGVKVWQLPSLWRQGMALAMAAARRQVLITSILIVASAIAAALRIGLYALLAKRLIELDGGQQSTGSLVWPLVGIGVLLVVEQVATTYQTTTHDVLSELVSIEANRRIVDVSTSVGLLAFESPDFYDQLQRAQSQAGFRPTQIVTGLRQLGRGLLTSVGILIGIAVVAPILVPLIVIIYAPMALALWIKTSQQVEFFRGMTRLDREARYVLGLLTSRQAAKEVRAFAMIPELRGRYDRLTAARIAELRKLKARQARTILAGNGGGLVLLTLVLLSTLYLYDRGSLPLGSAAAALIALRQLAGSVSLAGFGAVALHEGGAFLEDYSTFLDVNAPHGDRSDTVAVDGFDIIEAVDVDFRYPGADRHALQGMSIEVAAGQLIAVVGRNGSGKTTLAKVLAGLYPPTSGQLLVDGAPGVPGKVAVLFQDYMKYAFSANDNVALDAEADRDAVLQAAKLSGANPIIEELSEGWDTRLTREFEDGVDLSEGQWQRVALARAFFKDADLIVLDEPSAALDAEAESELFDRMAELEAGRTVVFVSHRFSSVRRADLIVVLDGGQIVEKGTHDQLIAAGGTYNDLYTLQASSYR